MHHIPESCSFYSVVSRANADIAHVRAKAKQEQVAYQASMRKEQMKVDSLERTLEQKVSSTSSVAVQWYTEMWNYLKYVNLCYRTKRLRSWLRSVMSWSLKWGRVSDYARSDLSEKNPSFALPKDWWTLKIRITFPADFVYRGATGMVSSSWLYIFFWRVIQCILLKGFQYHIIHECVWVCVWRKEHC